MKLPREIKRYCPHCDSHTTHKVIEVKSSPRGSLTKGQRSFKRKLKGYGSFPREKPKQSSKYGSKTSEKKDIRLECKECGKQHVMQKKTRTKNLNIE